MKLASALAIYFVIWWTVLFAVLPFGVRNSSEAGEDVQQGNEVGAPVTHGLVRKAMITTVISAVMFAAIYWALQNRDIWFG
jgi:predicted secreted protein